MTKEEIGKQIMEDIQKGLIPQEVRGAFGDMPNCDGLVEKKIEPPEGGLFTKFYGCDFLFNGFPDAFIVEGLALGKSMISMLPRKIVGRSFYWQLAILFRLLFTPKRFWHDIHIVFWDLYLNVVKKLPLPREKYNRVTNILRAAVYEALEKSSKKYNSHSKRDYLEGDIDNVDKREIWEAIAHAFNFAYLFIEMDNAYRFRLQDAILLINKENVKKNVIKEVWRILDIVIDREDHTHGIKDKWQELKWPIIGVLIFSRRLRYFTKQLLLTLDQEGMNFTPDDWYFCLARQSYNFKGISLRKRLMQRQKIDKERSHWHVQTATINDPKVNTCPTCKNSKQTPGIKISSFDKPEDMLVVFNQQQFPHGFHYNSFAQLLELKDLMDKELQKQIAINDPKPPEEVVKPAEEAVKTS